jgi:hypothetical protein
MSPAPAPSRGEDFAGGHFEAADQRFGFLTFVVGHIHSPGRAPDHARQLNLPIARFLFGPWRTLAGLSRARRAAVARG